jgi:rSAM/selenodomain-associated transferase 2
MKFKQREFSGKRLIVFTRYPEPGRVKTRLIPALGPDIDRPEDLPVWNHVSGKVSPESSLPGISIVIPAINEEDRIGQALESTQGAKGVVERIVVDGGSRDGTMKQALVHGARVIESVAGRSRQMNEGARRAQGDILLFLHADTRLPAGYENHVHRILGQYGTVAGAFRLAIDDPFPGLRWIEKLAHFRSVRMGMPYGDQAIFLAKDTFFRVGGFPEMPIMEDFELMRRLRRRGRIEIATAPVLTSARRYHAVGFLRTTLVNQAIILAYLSGIPPERLMNWYRKK